MIRNYIFFWTKTYLHRCPDGTIHRLYKNPDKAFPLALTDSKKHYEGVLKGLEGISEIGAKIINENNLSSLFLQIDKSNNSMMPKFRSAYMLYISEPCKGYKHYVRMTDEIHKEHKKLQRLLAKIEGLVNLAGLAKDNKDYKNLVNLYADLVNELGGRGISVIAALQIEESVKIAQDMLKK